MMETCKTGGAYDPTAPVAYCTFGDNV